jgi:hypothetical protein
MQLKALLFWKQQLSVVDGPWPLEKSKRTTLDFPQIMPNLDKKKLLAQQMQNKGWKSTGWVCTVRPDPLNLPGTCGSDLEVPRGTTRTQWI